MTLDEDILSIIEKLRGCMVAVSIDIFFPIPKNSLELVMLIKYKSALYFLETYFGTNNASIEFHFSNQIYAALGEILKDPNIGNVLNSFTSLNHFSKLSIDMPTTSLVFGSTLMNKSSSISLETASAGSPRERSKISPSLS